MSLSRTIVPPLAPKRVGAKGNVMSKLGEELIQSLNEALAPAKGEGTATVHAFSCPREVGEGIELVQAQMASPMGAGGPATVSGSGEGRE